MLAVVPDLMHTNRTVARILTVLAVALAVGMIGLG
jgi:hypothetical protein